MSRIELKLFGKPCLLIDGLGVNPGRPAVFEILAKTIVAGDAEISRAEIAKWMWPDLDSAIARANLRVNLTSLRIELDRLGIGSVVVTDGDLLRTQGIIDVDLHTFLSKPIQSVNELRMGTSPVAKGWNADRWQVQRDLVAVHLTSGFHTLGSKLPEDERLALLKEAAREHPTSNPLTTMLVDAYKRRQLLDAANQAVIDFENAWIDRFGTADLPNISLGPVPAPVETPRAADRKRIILAIAEIALLGIIVSIIVIYLLLYSRTEPGPQKPRLQLSLVQSYTKTVDGNRFLLQRYKVGNAYADQLQVEMISRTEARMSANEMSPVLVSQNGKIDPTTRNIARKEFGITVQPADISAGFSTDGKLNWEFKPTAEYPHIVLPILLDRSLILDRCCDHPFADHRRLSHFYDMAEHVVAPDGEQPQVTVSTYLTDRFLYGKYSYGRREGWRYHTFRYDILSHKFEKLSIPPVVGILDNHTLVSQPEVTTVHNDDYDTHPSGEVVVINQTTGKKIKERWVREGDPYVRCLPAYILNRQWTNARSWTWQFLDGQLKPVNPFPEIQSPISRLDQLTNSLLLAVPFYREIRSREFWLITRLDPL